MVTTGAARGKMRSIRLIVREALLARYVTKIRRA